MPLSHTLKNRDEFGLIETHQIFVREYLKKFNGTKAAIAAGIGVNGDKINTNIAGVWASNRLQDEKIQNAIRKIMEKRNKKLEIDIEWVLKQAVEIHLRCMQEVKPKTVIDKGTKERVPKKDDDGNVIYQFNATGATKSLELIGKHVDIQAFNEQSTIKRAYDDFSNEELYEQLNIARNNRELLLTKEAKNEQ